MQLAEAHRLLAGLGCMLQPCQTKSGGKQDSQRLNSTSADLPVTKRRTPRKATNVGNHDEASPRMSWVQLMREHCLNRKPN